MRGGRCPWRPHRECQPPRATHPAACCSAQFREQVSDIRWQLHKRPGGGPVFESVVLPEIAEDFDEMRLPLPKKPLTQTAFCSSRPKPSR